MKHERFDSKKQQPQKYRPGSEKEQDKDVLQGQPQRPLDTRGEDEQDQYGQGQNREQDQDELSATGGRQQGGQRPQQGKGQQQGKGSQQKH